MTYDALETGVNKMKAGLSFESLTETEQDGVVVHNHPEMEGQDLSDPLTFVRRYVGPERFDSWGLTPEQAEAFKYAFVDLHLTLYHPEDPPLPNGFRVGMGIAWRDDGTLRLNPTPEVEKLLPGEIWNFLTRFWTIRAELKAASIKLSPKDSGPRLRLVP